MKADEAMKKKKEDKKERKASMWQKEIDNVEVLAKYTPAYQV